MTFQCTVNNAHMPYNISITHWQPYPTDTQQDKYQKYLAQQKASLFHFNQHLKKNLRKNNMAQKYICYRNRSFQNPDFDRFKTQTSKNPSLSSINVLTLLDVRFHTVTSWPDLSKLSTIPDPIRPRPRNPIFIGVAMMFFDTNVVSVKTSGRNGWSESRARFWHQVKQITAVS